MKTSKALYLPTSRVNQYAERVIFAANASEAKAIQEEGFAYIEAQSGKLRNVTLQGYRELLGAAMLDFENMHKGGA